MAQLSYGYDTPKGNPGLIFDIAPHECRTRLIEGTAGSVAAGMGVVNGTAAGTQVKRPSAGTDVFAGVLVEKAHEMDKNGQVIVDPKEAFSVMVAGHIWGQLAENVTPTYGAEAYLVATGDDAGRFTTDNSGIATGAKFGAAVDAENGIAEIVL